MDGSLGSHASFSRGGKRGRDFPGSGQVGGRESWGWQAGHILGNVTIQEHWSTVWRQSCRGKEKVGATWSLQTQALGRNPEGRNLGIGALPGLPSHSHLFSGGRSSSQVSVLGTVSCSHFLSLYLVHLGPCRCTRSSRNLAEAHSVHPAPEFEGSQGRSWAPKGPSPEEREVGGTGQGGGSRTVLRGLGLGCAAVWGGERLG